MEIEKKTFEKTSVGKLKERLWNASDKEIDAVLKDYGIPSPGEMEKPGSYIQNTLRTELVETGRKNDIVLIPIGSTENHGAHTVSGFDTFLVTRIAEAVRRKTKKLGRPIHIAAPVNYGVHPPWHQGMFGTVMVSDDVARHKDGSIQRLDRLAHMPGKARFQFTFTYRTVAQVTIDNYSFCIRKLTMGTITGLFLHLSALAVFGMAIVYSPYR